MSTCERLRTRTRTAASRRARVLAFCTIWAGFGVSAWPNQAQASEIFPPTIRARWGLAADPACTICHATDQGDKDTVVKPFGVSMMRLGVTGGSDTAKLIAALDAAEAQQLDSDGDGIPDVTELREGSDPNDGVVLKIPQTGCSLDRSNGGSVATIVIVAGVAIAFSRRRRHLSPGVAQLANRSPRQC